MPEFPYQIDHGIADLKFMVMNAEAKAWYDPMKPYTKLEYDWVRDNLDLEGQVVVDAGAHHGHYAIVFKGAYNIVCFEMIHLNARFCNYNLNLNKVPYYAVNLVQLTAENTCRKYMAQAPDIYKMDIEGDEFSVLPVELQQNPQVHTWILELHPVKDPNILAKILTGFELLKVDRENMKVRPYKIGESWPTHATLIARKK